VAAAVKAANYPTLRATETAAKAVVAALAPEILAMAAMAWKAEPGRAAPRTVVEAVDRLALAATAMGRSV
jgi:hypothetical protein